MAILNALHIIKEILGGIIGCIVFILRQVIAMSYDVSTAVRRDYDC